MSTSWVSVAQEALKLPGLVVEIYGDLAKPGVRQVGKALDTVLGLGNTILWPIAWANERTKIHLEKNLESYRSRLETIPLEKVSAVPPEIGVPIAEKLAYVRDKRLSDLYVALLAKASCVDTVDMAHPSFVNVITNLSPDEAQLLEFFVDHSSLIFMNAKWVDPSNRSYSFAGQLLLHPDRLQGLVFPSNVPAYLSNLAGLGLVSIHEDRSLRDEAPHANYRVLEAHWRSVFPERKEEHPGRRLEFEGGAIAITELGQQFILACHE